MAFLSKWALLLMSCLAGTTWALHLHGLPQCAVSHEGFFRRKKSAKTGGRPALIRQETNGKQLSCALDTLKESSCVQSDMQCLCDDPFYVKLSAECVSFNCTVKEALVTKNLTSVACNEPVRDKDAVIRLTRPTTLVLKTVFVLLRSIVKMSGAGSGWAWDDYTIFGAFTVSIGMTTMAFLEQQHGEGRDIWTVEFPDISQFLKFFLIFQFLYVIVLGLTKSSILFFFLRHFSSSSSRLLVIQLSQMFNLFSTAAFAAATMLQCYPLSYFWTGWDLANVAQFQERGTCFNANALHYAHACINISLNIWLMIVPLTDLVWVRSLGGKRKKPGVILMFGAGIFLTVAAIMRVKSLWYYRNTANITRDYFGIIFWSSMEADGGIVLACLPAFRLLFTKVLAGLFNNKRLPHNRENFSRSEDGRVHISSPMNKRPLPEGHDWGFAAQKHGYYGKNYDDWDNRIRVDWRGGPRDWDPKTNAPPQGARNPQVADTDLAIVPPPMSPGPTLLGTGSPSPGGEQQSIDDLKPLPPPPPILGNHRRDTLQSQKGSLDTRATSTSRSSTLTWREKRDTILSRIGEIMIMIDKAILGSDGSSRQRQAQNNPPPDQGASIHEEAWI